MCGIPFKILDKKSEKSLLFTRRKQLTALLEQTTDDDDDLPSVLQLTTLLLFQQIRGNITITPHDTRTNTTARGTCPILSLLVKEKKVPEAVAAELTKAEAAVQRGEDGNGGDAGGMAAVVRRIGLDRDIAKGRGVLPSDRRR